MPRYKVRLDSPDDFRYDGRPHFRLSYLTAADEAEARAVCEQQEYKRAAYRMPDQVLADYEAKEAEDGATPGPIRFALVVHRQQRPYEIVKVEQVRG